MASEPDTARPYGLFHSYADDTPLDASDNPPEPLAAGWSDTPVWGHTEPPPERTSWRGPLVAGGASIALIAAGVGWAVMRDPAAPPAADPVSQAPLPEAAVSKPLEVVVVAPPPPPLPKTSERLEVLPRSGPVPARTPRAKPVIPVAPDPPRMVAQAPAPPPPVEAPNVARASREASVRMAAVPRRFDACGDAPTRAYEMVCGDMRLAEADRRMKRAYSAALAAGVPADELLRDQEDWLAVREDAARISRRAVADIYRQRTRELSALADRPWD